MRQIDRVKTANWKDTRIWVENAICGIVRVPKGERGGTDIWKKHIERLRRITHETEKLLTLKEME